MRNYEPPKGQLQTLATGLFLVGLGLNLLLELVFDETSWTPWIGITLMLVGVLLSISLLFVQWRKQR